MRGHRATSDSGPCRPLAVLKTDHAELSANLEKALRSAFAEMQGSAGQHVSTPPVSTSEPKRPRLDEPVEHMDSEPSAPPPPQQPPAGLPRPAAAETPIGVIDEVAARSPADTAGLRVGDVIFQLGAGGGATFCFCAADFCVVR